MTWLAIVALIVAAVSLLANVWLGLRVRRLGTGVMTSSGVSMATPGEAARIEALGSQVVALGRRIDASNVEGQKAMQRIGLVRFNPFADTGSNQSFALAILSGTGDGFVLSSMHSRQQTRVFLKSVAAGKPETATSEEETEAIRRALGA